MGTAENRLIAPALDAALAGWLDAHAAALDRGAEHAAQVLPRLAAAGLPRIGVPAAFGGTSSAGGAGHTGRANGAMGTPGAPGADNAASDACAAAAAIAAVAGHSMTAAFVLWGQRVVVECLLQGQNAALRERLLPALLDGSLAGATGLSNAMKFLCGFEELTIAATPRAAPVGAQGAQDPQNGAGWRLDGRLAWVTNLRPEGFVVAAAVAHGAAQPGQGQPASIFVIPHDAPGVARSADLDLIALRGSNTAALRFDATPVDAQWRLHADAPAFCAGVRPAFLIMQCGMPLGVARRSLAEAARAGGAARGVLGPEIEATSAALDALAAQLAADFADGTLHARPERLFQLRIDLTGLALAAVNLELQASGGRGYLRDAGLGFERRWLEAAFAPIVTPSSVQLKTQLAARAQAQAQPQTAQVRTQTPTPPASPCAA